MRVGDAYRLPAYDGGFRVWRIVAVILGAYKHESLVELETLDSHQGNDVSGKRSNALVPLRIFEEAFGQELLDVASPHVHMARDEAWRAYQERAKEGK